MKRRKTGRRDDAAEVARLANAIRGLADQLPTSGIDRGEAKLLAKALAELRYSFNLLSQFRSVPKVTVFGSARTAESDPRYKLAIEFGRRMAEIGYMVITGAGHGIMAAAHIGAGKAKSIGFNITLPFEQLPNEIIARDEKLIHFRYFFTRKLLFLKESSAIALFPGGFGTMDELFEALTLIQTGKAPIVPIVMVDTPEGRYWEEWRDYIENHLLCDGLISPEDTSLYRIVHSTDDAVREILRFYQVYHSQRYVRGQLVLRLKSVPSKALRDRLDGEFADLLNGGTFRPGDAHPDEANDIDAAGLFRLYVPFNRRSPGRLRQLIDLINDDIPTVSE